MPAAALTIDPDTMPRTDFRTPRVYVEVPLTVGTAVPLDRDQTNYLRNVLRLGQGDAVLLFNGRDGEWQAELALPGKRALAAVPGKCLREQPRPLDLHFMFAPLKHARLDYLVQKAVEMGVSLLQPVMTKHTRLHASLPMATSKLESAVAVTCARSELPMAVERALRK